MESIKGFIKFIFQHKKKYLVCISSSLLFLFILFPFNDLSDLITSQIAKVTNNTIFLQFDEIHLSPLPLPSVSFDRLSLDTPSLSGIKATWLKITPSIRGLIQQKPFGTINAEGFFKGDVEVSLSSGTKTESGGDRQKLDLSAQKISLADLQKTFNLPLQLRGDLSIESSALADLTFTEQPDVSVSLKIQQFELPTANVQTSFGPLTVPNLKLQNIDLKGRLSNGKFVIESGTLGQEKDEVFGTVKGDLSLSIQSMNNTFVPNIGAYNLEIDLQTKKQFLDRAGIYLALLNPYKIATDQGARYKFKATAENIQMPPNFSATQ